MVRVSRRVVVDGIQLPANGIGSRSFPIFDKSPKLANHSPKDQLVKFSRSRKRKLSSSSKKPFLIVSNYCMVATLPNGHCCLFENASFIPSTSLPSWRFQVLFDSLFKVLFTFPSQYFFAIGLLSIFSFRCGLTPQFLGLQSQTTRLKTKVPLIDSSSLRPRKRGFHALWLPFPWMIHDRERRTLVDSCQRLQLQLSLDFKSELFHLHSPLLVESLLFSFPPLTNMLKFGA